MDFDERMERRLNDAASHPFWFFLKLGVGAILVLSLLGVVATSVSVMNETVNVAREEFGPRELLRKYELFKDQHAQLQKKQADIKVLEARVAATTGDDRFALQNKFQAQSELAGVIASYNGLAADYNAGMAKINYRFTNIGMLPQGATDPLPREYAPYAEGGKF